MDVHEKKVDVCIAHGPFDKPPKFEIRTFSTMTSDLEELTTWLKKYEVTTIGMESTGIYWKPIFNVMEGEFQIVLANAQRLKAIPRKKTDIIDCKRIANLLRYGLVPNSFIPPKEIRELRDLNRTRRKLVGMMTSEKNRLVKVLEAANIKLSSVVTKIYGWYKTMNYNQPGFKLDQDHGLLHLSKIGDIRIKMHRKIQGCIKAVLIKREGRQWFAIVQADQEPESLPETGNLLWKHCEETTLGQSS